MARYYRGYGEEGHLSHLSENTAKLPQGQIHRVGQYKTQMHYVHGPGLNYCRTADLGFGIQ